MSFDRAYEAPPRRHASLQRAKCATCRQPIQERTAAGTTGAFEWAHLDPFDRHDATLCDVDYPRRAAAATRKDQPMKLTTLDPGDAFILDGNVRSKAGDVTALQKSIEQLGVLVPIIVRAEGSKWRVLAGQRRVLAAVAAGANIPAVIIDGLDTEVAALEAALAENLARVPLSEADEARGYEQLLAFGLDVGAIADVLSATPARVKAGLAVAGSKEALKRAEKNQLTLEQAATVAEFDDDKQAVARLMLTVKWRPGDLAHEASQLRTERRDAKKLDDARSRFAKQGVPVLDAAPSGWSPVALTGTARLDKLTDKAGKNLTGANHRKCPGHAVALSLSWQGLEQVFVCTDPKGNGHKARKGTERATGAKPAVDRADVVAGNKAWRAAEPVRRQFVAELLARKKPPAGTVAYLAGQVLLNYAGFSTGRHTVDELEGPAGQALALVDGERQATDTEATRALLAAHALDIEGNLDVQTWRSPSQSYARRGAAWFRFLEANDYTLSDIEKRVTGAKG